MLLIYIRFHYCLTGKQRRGFVTTSLDFVTPQPRCTHLHSDCVGVFWSWNSQWNVIGRTLMREGALWRDCFQPAALLKLKVLIRDHSWGRINVTHCSVRLHLFSTWDYKTGMRMLSAIVKDFGHCLVAVRNLVSLKVGVWSRDWVVLRWMCLRSDLRSESSVPRSWGINKSFNWLDLEKRFAQLGWCITFGVPDASTVCSWIEAWTPELECWWKMTFQNVHSW